MKNKVIHTTILTLFLNGYSLASSYAVVNGEKLTDEDIKPILGMFHKAETFDQLNENEKIMVLDQSIERKLIIQNAGEKKFEERDDFKKIVDDFKKRLLIEFWMKQKMQSVKVNDEDIKSFFEKNRDKYPKEAKLEEYENEIKDAVKMEKFQLLVDETLSKMKKDAKIDFTGGVKVNYK